MLKHTTCEKRKNSFQKWKDRFHVKMFGSGGANFQQSADCQKFGSLERVAAYQAEVKFGYIS